MTDADQRREWHLDRKVTIGLIVALMMHAGSTVWWAASISNRVAHLEDVADRTQEQPERLARLEAQIASLSDYLRRIDSKMDRLFETRK
ncbi:hypothetical protein [Stappia indica]|uniref:hypothetical protein n=1 Tax=Stappia indica TaxID=538381 RepID=UPI001CD5D853|nr:hypothetical protein [Stappia indica]MCA1298049.1 hypothetical protein [Stappia indica]